MLHTERWYGGNQVGLTCVLECWFEVLEAVYHSGPCGEASLWLYNLLCLGSGCLRETGVWVGIGWYGVLTCLCRGHVLSMLGGWSPCCCSRIESY